MKKYLINESELRTHFVQRYSFLDVKLYIEVPVFSRSVDAVLHNIKDNSLTAIEFKLNDWRRAMQQAVNVSLCFDYLEICIPMPKQDRTKKTILDYCSEIGIGVYFFSISDMSFSHPLMPQKITTIWQTQKSKIIKYLGGS